MKKVVFSIYDMQADYFDSPMVFDDLKLGVGSIRRNIRDMYLRHEVTLDALRDRKLVVIGQFDSTTGKFEESEEDYNFSVRMSDFVGDLVVEDGE